MHGHMNVKSVSVSRVSKSRSDEHRRTPDILVLHMAKCHQQIAFLIDSLIALCTTKSIPKRLSYSL